MDSSASSLTGLGDSAEYLGWDSQRQLADGAEDLRTDIDGGGGEEDLALEEEEENLDPPEKFGVLKMTKA